MKTLSDAPGTNLPAPIPTTAYMRSTWSSVIEERDRLRWVIDMIAESVIVKVVTVGTSQDVTWGCGICQGVALGYDQPDGRGVYAHKDWCPRK